MTKKVSNNNNNMEGSVPDELYKGLDCVAVGRTGHRHVVVPERNETNWI